MNLTDGIYPIIFNGPPSAGKDHSVKFLTSVWKDQIIKDCDVYHEKFAAPLKNTVSVFFGREIDSDFRNAFEDSKDTPLKIFNNLSYRQVQISLSTWAKETLGSSIFGDLLSQRVIVRKMHRKASTNQLVFPLISDGGFIEELQPLLDKYGHKRVLVVRIHRHGCSYSGDSRSFLPNLDTRGAPINIIDLQNKGDSGYEFSLVVAVKKFLRENNIMVNRGRLF